MKLGRTAPPSHEPATIAVDGTCAAPRCCGTVMRAAGGCSNGCCDDWLCTMCGYKARIEWLEEGFRRDGDPDLATIEPIRRKMRGDPEADVPVTQRTRFTAYITKFALTSGILEREVEDCFDTSPWMVCDNTGKFPAHYHKGDWYRTRAEAVAKANAMRLKKIGSLHGSLKKLEDMKF